MLRPSMRRHIVVRMVKLGELQEQVAVSYDRLGMPSWPNPHAEAASPREEEYSRLTDPERYAIVHTRARIWANKLGDIPGVGAEPLAPAPLDDEGHLGQFDRGVRLTSPRPDTLPLLLLERDVRWPGLEAPLAVLHISVAQPRIAVARLPDCGCDACDWGSDDLLHAIDETVGNIIGGPFVALRATGWHALWHPGGGSSGSTGHGMGPSPDHTHLMDLCHRLAAGENAPLPTGTEALVGHPWLNQRHDEPPASQAGHQTRQRAEPQP